MTKPSLKLNQFIAALPDIREISGNMPDVVYSDVCFDSRKITAGALYVAIPGINANGHNFIQNAIQNGACAVIGSEALPVPISVPYIRVNDSREAMALACAALNEFPSRDMTMIGITGTDGKTTTAIYLYHILQAAGLKTGLISTVSAIFDGKELDTGFHVTTPDAPDIQRYLAQMRDAGITHVICEVTSHGLAQRRVAAIDFDIAIVTNITHEHLDYHNTRESYFAAKGILFQNLGKRNRALKPLAILNKDDEDSYEFLKKITKAPKIAYSAQGNTNNTISRIESIESSPEGIRAKAVFNKLPGKNETLIIEVRTKLLGNYNGANFLAAMTAAIYGLNIDPQIATEGIAAVEGVPGRMQVIDYGQPFTAIVDFAHTPNALEKALTAARKMLRGVNAEGKIPRIIAVYGSAGLRDREKRRMMPTVSAKMADITILTAEDPRTEPLNGILKEMADEATEKGAVMGQSLFIQPDRRDAIRFALRMAQPGDIVLSLGKGHEQSMCFGEKEYLWDDRTAMSAALCEMMGMDGPQMPYLPDCEPYSEENKPCSQNGVLYQQNEI